MAKAYGLVRFEGVENAIRRLAEIERRIVNKGIREGYMDGAEIVRVDAALRAPVDRGQLAGDMVKEWDSRGKRARVGPGRASFYGYFQEFGTSRHAAQPFLRPALDSNHGQVLHAIGNRLKQTIESRVI